MRDEHDRGALRLGRLDRAFKRHLAKGPRLAIDVLADMERYAHVYARFESEPQETALGRFLHRLNTIEVTTAYPALLWLLGPDGVWRHIEGAGEVETHRTLQELAISRRKTSA